MLDSKVIVVSGGGKYHLGNAAEYLSNQGLLEKYLTAGYPKGYLGKLLERAGSRGARLSERRLNIQNSVIKSFWIAEIVWQAIEPLSKSRNRLLRKIKQRLNPLLFHSFNVQSAYWLRKFLKGHPNPEKLIILCRSGYGSRLAPLAIKYRIPLVIDHSLAHPRFLIEKKLAREKSKFLELQLNDLESANLIIVNSTFVEQTCIEAGIPRDKIRVLYLQVDEAFLSVKHNHFVNENFPRKVLFAGTVGLRKGVLNLLRLIEDPFRTWNLTIIGDWDGEVLNLKHRFENAENVKLLPTLSKQSLINEMIQHDVFLFPTEAEGSARIVMEAMAIGIPVVTTTFAGAAGEPDTHWFELDNNLKDEELRAKFSNLVNDSARLKFIGGSGNELISKMFLRNSYGERLIKLLNETQCTH